MRPIRYGKKMLTSRMILSRNVGFVQSRRERRNSRMDRCTVLMTDRVERNTCMLLQKCGWASHLFRVFFLFVVFLRCQRKVKRTHPRYVFTRSNWSAVSGHHRKKCITRLGYTKEKSLASVKLTWPKAIHSSFCSFYRPTNYQHAQFIFRIALHTSRFLRNGARFDVVPRERKEKYGSISLITLF